MRAVLARAFRNWLRHWSYFEWLGFRFYWQNGVRITGDVWRESLRPLRVCIAVPSFGVAFWLWSDSVAYSYSGFKYISPWIPENALGAVFAVHGVGMVWRVYAHTRQMGWSMFLGALGMTVYTAYPLFVFLDIGRITGQGIAMFGWAWMCTWITARLGSSEDRSGP